MKISQCFSHLTSVLIFTIASGCAYGPQFISIDPEVNVSEGDFLETKEIALEILDSRTQTKLGVVGDDSARFNIELKGDLPTIISPKLTKALENRGLLVREQSETTKKLVVNIQRMTIDSVKTKSFGYKTDLHVELLATVVKDNSKFAKRFVVTTEKKMGSFSSSAETQKIVNEALSDALSSIVNDEALFELLHTDS